ncbi:MAG: hypothetical protein WCF30_17810 [Terracidiphilus sp.]
MAEFKTTQTRTLGDGSTVTHETSEIVAVDSQGRRMIATATVPSPGDQRPETRFTVVDPVTHTRINWTSPGKEAMVSAIPISAASQSSCGWVSFSIGVIERPGKKAKAPRVKTAVEDLGMETIQGVKARGRRTTTTTTWAGPKRRMQAQVSRFEIWRAVAPELRGLLAREVSDDPQQGKMTKELVQFRQAKPDPSIFQLPPGYEVVNREVAMDWCPSADDVEAAPAQ